MKIHTKNIAKIRIGSLFLAFILLVSQCFAVGSTVWAEDENFSVWQNASAVEYDTNNDTVNDTAKVTMEAYAASPLQFSTEEHVTGCDITFVFDQSKAMNAHRQDIIQAANDLVATLPQPTDAGDEHRIAIAGYGRLHNNGAGDSTAGYTGTYRAARAYNSGIYSYKNNAIEFYTEENGFTYGNDGTADTVDSEGNVINAGVLPQLIMSNTIQYDDVFLSEDDARIILTDENMNMWNAGGCRMDVGMRLVQELNRLALNHDSNRPQLIVMFSAGNPIQNNHINNTYTSRLGAVNEALTDLIDSGIFFYTLGDWGPINNSSYDTAAHFEDSMLHIAASPYHYISVTNSTQVERQARLRMLIDSVNQGVANIELLESVNITATTDDVGMQFDISLLEALYDFDEANATMKLYPFREYTEDGEAVFFDTPREIKTVSVTETENSLTYSCTVNTIPTYDFYTYAYYPSGYKVVVEVLGTRQEESIGISTRRDNVHFNAGTITITDGTNTYTLTEESSGIYKFTGFLNRNTEYTVLIDGEPVKRADGTNYTISAGESQVLDWYSVYFRNRDGSAYSDSSYDYDGTHKEYVISGTVLTNDTGKSAWYTSQTDHSAQTKFNFSKPITNTTTLYWDNAFTFSYYTAFNYKEPWEISCYGALKYDGRYIDALNDSNVSNCKVYVYRAALGEKVPDMAHMKSSWKTTVYQNVNDFLESSISGVNRFGIAYNDIYIYQMKNPVYVAFEVTYDGVTYTSAIKDRSLYNVNETYINEAGNGYYTTFKERQLNVLTKMRALYTAVSAVVSGKSDAPDYPNGAPIEALPLQNQQAYTFAPSATIRNIEPWGYKLEATLNGGELADLTDFGVLVCRNKEATAMTLEEVLTQENTLQYSFAGNNLFYQNNTLTAYYFDDLYAANLQDNIFVVFYASNGSGYTYSEVQRYNYDEIAEANGNTEWRSVSDAICEFAQAVKDYERK